MICPYCNREITDNATYCPECGQSVLNQKHPSHEVENFWNKVQRENNDIEQQKQRELIEEGNKRKYKIGKMIGVIVLIFACIVVALWSFPKIKVYLAPSNEQSSYDVKSNTELTTQEDNEVSKEMNDLNESNTEADFETDNDIINENEADEAYILPNSDSSFISYEDLDGLSEWEVRLARNEIMARHGRRFKDQSLQDYFDGCSWYYGSMSPEEFDENYESNLNQYEKKNATTIKEYEKEHGYNQ